MKKNEAGNKYSFEFDEKGTTEVSEQIMDAYNSGFIDQDDFQSTASQADEDF